MRAPRRAAPPPDSRGRTPGWCGVHSPPQSRAQVRELGRFPAVSKVTTSSADFSYRGKADRDKKRAALARRPAQRASEEERVDEDSDSSSAFVDYSDGAAYDVELVPRILSVEPSLSFSIMS